MPKDLVGPLANNDLVICSFVAIWFLASTAAAIGLWAVCRSLALPLRSALPALLLPFGVPQRDDQIAPRPASTAPMAAKMRIPRAESPRVRLARSSTTFSSVRRPCSCQRSRLRSVVQCMVVSLPLPGTEEELCRGFRTPRINELTYMTC